MKSKPRISEVQGEQLLNNDFLQEPSQQRLLKRYLAGELDSEHLADELFYDVLKLLPVLEQKRLERAMEEAGITASEERSEPVFIHADEWPAATTTTENPDEAQIHPSPVAEPAAFDGGDDEFRRAPQFETD